MLCMPAATADRRSAATRSRPSDIATSRPSDDTTAASLTPGTPATKFETSQLRLRASVLKRITGRPPYLGLAYLDLAYSNSGRRGRRRGRHRCGPHGSREGAGPAGRGPRSGRGRGSPSSRGDARRRGLVREVLAWRAVRERRRGTVGRGRGLGRRSATGSAIAHRVSGHHGRRSRHRHRHWHRRRGREGSAGDAARQRGRRLARGRHRHCVAGARAPQRLARAVRERDRIVGVEAARPGEDVIGRLGRRHRHRRGRTPADGAIVSAGGGGAGRVAAVGWATWGGGGGDGPVSREHGLPVIGCDGATVSGAGSAAAEPTNTASGVKISASFPDGVARPAGSVTDGAGGRGRHRLRARHRNRFVVTRSSRS